ncbi:MULTISPECIES: hypothetical protein [unclassified Streptomyces]|nr:hypothetical protein [Streptomyces sp. KAU_LT]MDI9830159.1 hypothetical protein [Streptomyces sp. KAU_LT]
MRAHTATAALRSRSRTRSRSRRTEVILVSPAARCPLRARHRTP